MSIVERFAYDSIERITRADGVRHYICPRTGQHLPSVTTVLQQTADQAGLMEWRTRVGERQADAIKREALALGTLMHTHLEKHLAGAPRPTGTNLIRVQAAAMADQIIAKGLSQVLECYGCELALYYPGLYAGTADAVGTVKTSDVPTDRDAALALIDFKSARKMKTRDQIEDYFMQIAAYILCHNERYGTDISQGIIFMVDRDLRFEQFVLAGADLGLYQNKWIDRLDQYCQLPPPEGGGLKEKY